MSTGIESWAGNVADIGPLYPFAGSEGIMWIVGLAFWIIWAIAQDREESRQYQKDIDRFTSSNRPG